MTLATSIFVVNISAIRIILYDCTVYVLLDRCVKSESVPFNVDGDNRYFRHGQG